MMTAKNACLIKVKSPEDICPECQLHATHVLGDSYITNHSNLQIVEAGQPIQA